MKPWTVWSEDILILQDNVSIIYREGFESLFQFAIFKLEYRPTYLL